MSNLKEDTKTKTAAKGSRVCVDPVVMPDHKVIYLVHAECDGALDIAWCPDPAPGNDMALSDAVEYVRADLMDEVKSSVVNAFGKSPVACDGMLLVPVDKYDRIAEALNAICEA